MGLDPRRTFNRREVWRAWQLQDRKCKLCARAIPFDLMHGDHVVAWSRGGPTTLDNLQALCGSCNLRKGSQPQEVLAATYPPELLRAGAGTLRPWQLEAVQLVRDTIEREPVLIEACPGAGKTHFGLEVTLEVAIWGLLKLVRPYLEARSARLAEIANPARWEFGSPIVPVLWEERGGWGDDVDWGSRSEELRERTSQWLEVLSELRPRLIAELSAEDS